MHSLPSNLRAASAGLVLAILTILFGQGMGIVFGLNEDSIKSRLKANATDVQSTIYKGDTIASKAVIDKSWNYMQRAHLHAGGMGATALALIIVVCLVGASRIISALINLVLDAGGLGYSIFWMWAGFRAPGLGSTGAAKESLKWLAMPSSGGFVLATISVLICQRWHRLHRQPERTTGASRVRIGWNFRGRGHPAADVDFIGATFRSRVDRISQRTGLPCAARGIGCACWRFRRLDFGDPRDLLGCSGHGLNRRGGRALWSPAMRQSQ